MLEAHSERAEIRLRNLFTEEEFVAHDVAGSRQMAQWDLIISRLMRIEGHLRLSGIITRMRARAAALFAVLHGPGAGEVSSGDGAE